PMQARSPVNGSATKKNLNYRRPRDQRSGDAARGPDRCPMGAVGAAVAPAQEDRPSLDVDETTAHRRDPVADPGRLTLARRAPAVRILAGDLRPVPALATRRCMGLHPENAAGLR